MIRLRVRSSGRITDPADSLISISFAETQMEPELFSCDVTIKSLHMVPKRSKLSR